MSFAIRVSLAAVLAGLAVACSPDQGPSDQHAPGSPVPPTPPPVSQPSTPSAPTGPVTLEVEFRDGQVAPPARTVPAAVGSPVKIRVTSDRKEDIEIVGYPDKTEDVGPGDPESVDFTPDKPGDVLVRLKSGPVLLTLNVR